jgi:hypothetical protein
MAGRASLLDVRGRAQVRTYHYPYTYTFYSVEHFLDAKGLDVRLSHIAGGRIIAHFDENVGLMGCRRGFLDFHLETREDTTRVRMVSSFYNRVNDPSLWVVRERVLRRLQVWLDGERTMTLPRNAGDIPRFRQDLKARLLMVRNTRLGPPDTTKLARYMSGLGALVILSGFVLVLGMGIFPRGALVLVLLSGLPFVLVSMIILEGNWELALSVYSSVGILAGLTYMVLTVFVGLIFVLLPLAVIDETIWEVRTWDRFQKELEGDGDDRSIGAGGNTRIGHTAKGGLPRWT